MKNGKINVVRRWQDATGLVHRLHFVCFPFRPLCINNTLICKSMPLHPWYLMRSTISMALNEPNVKSDSIKIQRSFVVHFKIFYINSFVELTRISWKIQTRSLMTTKIIHQLFASVMVVTVLLFQAKEKQLDKMWKVFYWWGLASFFFHSALCLM